MKQNELEALREFDLKDYQANTGKYHLFKTARIACNDLPGFELGEYVAVRFLRAVSDYAKSKGEKCPVFEVKTRTGEVRHLFANALADFCL